MTGQIEKAVILLQERARLSPEDFYTQYWLGEALIRSAPEAGSAADRESIAALESSIRLDPDFEPAHFQLGKLLLRRGDIDRAVHELEKAMALDPTDQGPVLQLARVYQRKGDAARAKELTAQAIKLRGRAMEDSDRQALKRIVRTVVPGSSTNPTSQ
jgi:tetratricopeptide (TPR) repeat protein